MEGFDDVAEKGSDRRCINGEYKFKAEPPHILNSALKNNPLSGITFPRLLRLLYLKRRSIDWWRYKHRIVALALMGVVNSFLEILEMIYMFYLRRYYTTTPQQQDLILLAEKDDQSPVFVLGHPRTGTTLLHSLFALDEERFSICDTFMAGFPHCFLIFERVGKFLFSGILTETRPMDNMKLHFDLPQEDELATNLLSGCLVSPYSSIMFFREEREFRKYQSMREDMDDTPSVADIECWSKSFRYLMTKIKMRDLIRQQQQQNNNNSSSTTTISGGANNLYPKRLLLKSPSHTGKARLLKKLYPDAKFVFIHRNPYELFLSGAHMASTTYGYWFLQEPSDADLQEYILSQGEILHNEYLSCVDDGVLNDNNHVQVSFQELTKDPFNSMKYIYSKLGLDSFQEESMSQYPSRLNKECKDLKDYKRNSFDNVKLDEELIGTIRSRWSRQFEIFGYSKDFPHSSSS